MDWLASQFLRAFFSGLAFCVILLVLLYMAANLLRGVWPNQALIVYAFASEPSRGAGVPTRWCIACCSAWRAWTILALTLPCLTICWTGRLSWSRS